jgi:hypothetical protein
LLQQIRVVLRTDLGEDVNPFLMDLAARDLCPGTVAHYGNESLDPYGPTWKSEGYARRIDKTHICKRLTVHCNGEIWESLQLAYWVIQARTR